MYSASAGRKVAMYLVSPRKPRTLVAVVGCGQAVMQSVLRGLGLIPAPETMWLRKHNLVANRLILPGYNKCWPSRGLQELCHSFFCAPPQFVTR